MAGVSQKADGCSPTLASPHRQYSNSGKRKPNTGSGMCLLGLVWPFAANPRAGGERKVWGQEVLVNMAKNRAKCLRKGGVETQGQGSAAGNAGFVPAYTIDAGRNCRPSADPSAHLPLAWAVSDGRI